MWHDLDPVDPTYASLDILISPFFQFHFKNTYVTLFYWYMVTNWIVAMWLPFYLYTVLVISTDNLQPIRCNDVSPKSVRWKKGTGDSEI